MNAPSTLLWTVSVSVLFLSGCGGSGGGSGQGAFQLTDVKYARLVESAGNQTIQSPLTTIETDPITGLVVPGSLKTLDPSIDPGTLVSLGLGPSFLPRVVPRNGVLVLQFSDQVDPGSVRPDTLAADGTVLSDGSVQVRFQKQQGQAKRGVEVELIVKGRQIWVNPVTDTQVGFPPSPVDFGPNGEPRADATGFLRLILDDVDPIRSVAGDALVARGDGLGAPKTPIGFNPGNEVLDFIAQNNLIPTNETFNGFLPDLTQPRIIREHKFEHTIDLAQDTVTASSITFAGASFSTTAQDGRGEWAFRQLVLREGKKTEEKHEITGNTKDQVTIRTPFQVLPQDGDQVELVRAEFFEPDLNDPIDPDLFDPNNPQNSANTQLLNFVEVFEIDAQGNAIGSALTLRNTVPAFSELRVRFNEPIDLSSLGQWETFQVMSNPDPGFGFEKAARLVVNSRQDVVRIQPALFDDATGAVTVVGWGPGVQALRFEIVTVPTTTFLQQRMNSQDVRTFLDQGVRGVTDLGGRPLGFPASLFDPNDPPLRYAEPFFSDESASTQSPPPASPDYGMIVHRFQGRPITGTDGPTGNPGVKFVDQTDMYWPIADVNLAVNGFLAGPPVVFITKVHDEFFPPPDGQFGPFPLGTAFPLSSFFTASASPPWEHNGARFQHLYRDVDASPGRDSLKDTLLDLFRVSWAPIGGNVTTDTYEDISIHASHSYIRPFTNQNGASASDPFFGLNEAFDFDSYVKVVVTGVANWCPEKLPYDAPNHYDKDYFTVVSPGTQYKVTQSKLFSPPFDNNAFHPWPEFEQPFQYNNGGFPQAHQDQIKKMNKKKRKCGNCGGGKPWKKKRGAGDGDSLLLEYRIRPQSTTISRLNGFVFSPAILIDHRPYFRVFSLGDRGSPMDPDDILNDLKARCATDPSPTGSGNRYGDNSRYFAVFDYVKTTAVITSPYVRVTNTTNPAYAPPFVSPPLGAAPAGTQVVLEFEGADRPNGKGGTGFDPDVTKASGQKFLAFRVTLVGSTKTLLSPNFDLVAIPFLRQ